MKQTEVLERVYDPGRLWAAWQQVKHNAGAAGIDQMTVGEFEARQEELLELIQEKVKAETYRFKLPLHGFTRASPGPRSGR